MNLNRKYEIGKYKINTNNKRKANDIAMGTTGSTGEKGVRNDDNIGRATRITPNRTKPTTYLIKTFCKVPSIKTMSPPQNKSHTS
ncbi:MAG TPA: hypothetical protein PLP35_02430 [Caldisericia bacterium]|nr:hypothetical protein [Caldisericia bacterium]